MNKGLKKPENIDNYPSGATQLPGESKRDKWNTTCNIIADYEDISFDEAERLLENRYEKMVEKYELGRNLEYV